ncbi:hypothetical protein PC116_g28047 [Phytophthora cactorum]|uniref:Uncharacterized protein n=1 Tax=Phytophthora cactorum TaxID=29920 RepID=A0A8T1AC25_9STRA|nr:hypothetical protein PC113_g23580 [Phytophthora cactorum]KAG2875163.1 hypothetical protein PC115_g23979 [Phytophthora cactorum]KAG4223487.1 hypothetical protein PC116_g28047 [Phytophthora cactorum]
MVLSRFAFDLVEAEFNYATSGRADYDFSVESEVVSLESRRTGLAHTVNFKVS